jgi:hypothetical protein
MTVKELKEAITLLPDDMIVIIQKDSEGNDYSPLSDADADCVYIAETTWYGEVYPTSWSAEDADMEDEEWEEIKLKPRVLVLAPVN